METAQVVALLTFVLVALLVAAGVRRAGAVLFRTRVAENFRGDVRDLDRRVSASLSEVIVLIDAVRRHAAEPESLRPALAVSTGAVDGYLADARALGGPAAARVHLNALIGELERVARALELVAHGCDLAVAGRGYGRGLEVDTAIKRGYLNLVHALETFTAHAASAVAAAEEASPARRFRRG
jgi:hypothetical protein